MSAVDARTLTNYLESLVPERPGELAAMEEYARDTGFPIIGPVAGYHCYQLARMIGARSVYELGSGYGYSTAWFAQAVHDNGGGVVHHVVWDGELSRRARGHLSALGLGDIVSFQVSEAVEALAAQKGPFDLIFCDIDKEGYPAALDVIAPRLRTGGLLIADNALWHGRVADPADTSEATTALREFSRRLSSDPAWVTTLIPVRDGLIVAYRV